MKFLRKLIWCVVVLVALISFTEQPASADCTTFLENINSKVTQSATFTSQVVPNLPINIKRKVFTGELLRTASLQDMATPSEYAIQTGFNITTDKVLPPSPQGASGFAKIGDDEYQAIIFDCVDLKLN